MIRLSPTTNPSKAIDVVDLDAVFPGLGRWTAYATTTEQLEPGETCDLIIDNVKLRCAVEESYDNDTNFRTVLVGGAGYLLNNPTAQHLIGTSVRQICTALLLGTTETLSGNSTASLLTSRLKSWQVTSLQPIAVQLSTLLNKVKARWTVDTDGTVLIEPKTKVPAITIPDKWAPDAIDGHDGRLSFNVDKLEEFIAPNCTVDDVTYNEVRIVGTASSLKYVFEVQSETTLFNDAINRRIQHLTSFLATYPATVVKVNPDGSFDVKVDDVGINDQQRGLTFVQVRYGLPGIKVTCDPGTRVYVAFDAADPSTAFIQGFFADGGKDYLTTMGGTSAEFVALSNLVLAELEAIKDDLTAFKAAYDNHIHVTTATIGASTTVGVISPTASKFPTPHTPGSVACETLKAR